MTPKTNLRPRTRKLSRRQVHELLRREPTNVDPQLSDVGCVAHRFDDGRVLLVFEEDAKGILYESVDELEALVARVQEAVDRGPEHSAAKLIPQGRQFTQVAVSLAAQAGRALGIPDKALDGTERSLDSVEEAVRRLGARKCRTKGRFPALVAFVGEVIGRATGGCWDAFQDEITGTWEPIIRDPSGRIYQPFSIVHNELALGAGGSIRGAVDETIRAHRLGAGD